MAFRRWLKLTAIGVAALLMVGFFVMWQRGRADIAGEQTRGSLDVKSSSFTNGEWMPSRLTCQGASLSPALEYSRLPAGTNSVAIVMNDSDSPIGFVHWLVYNIPAEGHSIGEGASSLKALPPGATEGINSADANGYIGPCPPRGKHDYVIRIYALDTLPNLRPGLTKQQLASAIRGHVLAEGQLTGVYARSGS